MGIKEQSLAERRLCLLVEVFAYHSGRTIPRTQTTEELLKEFEKWLRDGDGLKALEKIREEGIWPHI